jgi:hypothetical protein
MDVDTGRPGHVAACGPLTISRRYALNAAPELVDRAVRRFGTATGATRKVVDDHRFGEVADGVAWATFNRPQALRCAPSRCAS